MFLHYTKNQTKLHSTRMEHIIQCSENSQLTKNQRNMYRVVIFCWSYRTQTNHN